MSDFNFDDLLSKITSDPSIMNQVSEIAKGLNGESMAEKIPAVIDAIKPRINDEAKNTDTSSAQSSETKAEPSSVKLPSGLNKISEKVAKNSKLLMALKPYLNKERGDAIDNIVKMAQVANLMSNVK